MLSCKWTSRVMQTAGTAAVWSRRLWLGKSMAKHDSPHSIMAAAWRPPHRRALRHRHSGQRGFCKRHKARLSVTHPTAW